MFQVAFLSMPIAFYRSMKMNKYFKALLKLRLKYRKLLRNTKDGLISVTVIIRSVSIAFSSSVSCSF